MQLKIYNIQNHISLVFDFMSYTSSGSLRQAGPRRLTAASLAMPSIHSRSTHLSRHVSHRQVSSPRPTPLRLASLIVGGGFKLMFHGTSKRKGVGVIVVRHSKMTTSSGTTWIGWSSAAHLKLGEYHLTVHCSPRGRPPRATPFVAWLYLDSSM